MTKIQPSDEKLTAAPQSQPSGCHQGALDLPPLLVTVADFQRLCGIKKTTAFAWLREKRVRSVVFNRKRLVCYADVQRLVAEALDTGTV